MKKEAISKTDDHLFYALGSPTCRRSIDTKWPLDLYEMKVFGESMLFTDTRITTDDKEFITVDFRHDDEGGQVEFCSMEDGVMVNYSGSAIMLKETYDKLRKRSIRDDCMDVYLYDNQDDIELHYDREHRFCLTALHRPFWIEDKSTS